MNNAQIDPEYVQFLRDKEKRERDIELARAKVQSRAGEKDESGFCEGQHFFRRDRVITKGGEVHQGLMKIDGNTLIVKKPGFFRDKITVVHLDEVKDVN